MTTYLEIGWKLRPINLIILVRMFCTMNITIFIGGLSGGGAERVVCNLSNFLSNKHNVTILTMSPETPAYQLSKKINRISLIENDETKNYLIKNFKRIFRFRKYIRNSNADIYLTMLPGTINIMLMHRHKINVPIVISERCNPQERYENSKIKKWLMEKLYPKADGFVFQTKEAMKYYEEIIGNKGTVIPNAINPEFVTEPYRGIRKKSIVSAGRFTEQKNFPLLIKAFSKITKKHPDYDLVIYGDGPQKKQLARLAKELKLEDKVKFPGYINDFGDKINDSSLFVLPSNYEGMPNALMEAMALGLPCISTDCPVGGPRFLIDDGENGLLTSVGETEELVDAINLVLEDKSIANKLGKTARKISIRLNPDNIYSLWETFLKEL